jgi:cyanate lyase
MTKDEMREAIVDAKASKGMTWEQIAEKVGASPVFVTSACLGEHSLTEEQAEKLTGALGLKKDVASALTDCPMKARQGEDLMNDPCIYRLKEISLVYGETFKELVHEKFGDGIMSAIDFNMHVEREEDPKGDRVKVTMSGKFLPYKRW